MLAVYIICAGGSNMPSECLVREALRLGAMKLPVTTRIVQREDW